MAEVKSVEHIGRVYRATLDDGTETILFDTVDALPVAPAPQTPQKAAQKAAPEPEPESEGPNPFSKAHWNLTQQAQLKKKDPAVYKRLKAAAGR
jgi:hypothetical protein